jgi:ribosomal protein S18 acetylase RimI-like enzyme
VPPIEVLRTYLEITDPGQLRGRVASDPAARFVVRRPCPVERYRALYRAVGERWHWHDRNAWSDEELATYLASPNVVVWELLVGEESAGYVELRRDPDAAVEIVYFGLDERFFGRGLGAALLTHAVTEGFAMGARRVWLHTCSLDSPRALPNYQARGFRPYRTERYCTDIGGSPDA